jgi:hypothetical protein
MAILLEIWRFAGLYSARSKTEDYDKRKHDSVADDVEFLSYIIFFGA